MRKPKFLEGKQLLSILITVFASVFIGAGFVFAAITLSQNIQIGSGTPNLALDGDDLYVTGTFEVDGISRFDATSTFNSDLVAKTGGAATFIVAANDASFRMKNQADYVADGTADDVQIQAAIDALPAGGGKVMLSEGTFNITAAINIPSNTMLQGQNASSTIIQTGTNGINAVQLHGTGASAGQLVERSGIRDLKIAGTSPSPDSHGLSLLYADKNHFSNLHIYGFDGHGIKIEVGWDNYWEKIHVEWSGSNTESEAAVLLTNNANGNSNSNKFFALRIEPFRYRALQLDEDKGSGASAHYNVFSGMKIHGDLGVNNTEGIYVAGNLNFFNSSQIEQLGTNATATIIASSATGTQFYQTIVARVKLAFDVDSNFITIDGLYARGGASKEITNGLDISGERNIITNVHLIELDGWGITVSGHNNLLSQIHMSAVDEQGVIVTGNVNRFINVSPSNDVGKVSGEAMEVSGDSNQIIGGRSNGTGNKTIQFNAGADNNRVIGASVTKAIINNGTGNTFSKVQGFVTENSATASIANASTTVTVSHGLDVTPSAGDCWFIGQENPTTDVGTTWVDGYTSTQITLNVENDPGASNFDVAWFCEVR